MPTGTSCSANKADAAEAMVVANVENDEGEKPAPAAAADDEEGSSESEEEGAIVVNVPVPAEGGGLEEIPV